jgi:hypothetical protein
MLALCVLAQSAPPPLSAEWQGGLITLGVLVLIALNIWDKVRRKPPLEDIFATKKDSEAADARFERELKGLDERTDRKLEAMERRREQGEKDNRDLLHREIAGIKEFISDRISENRESNASQFGEMNGRISALTTSFQGLSNDLMHQVGRLEGRTEKISKA